MKQCPHCGKEIESGTIFKEHVRQCFFEVNNKELITKSNNVSNMEKILADRREVLINFYCKSRGVNAYTFWNENIDVLTHAQKSAVDYVVSKAQKSSISAESNIKHKIENLLPFFPGTNIDTNLEKVKLYVRDSAPLLIHVNLKTNLKYYVADDHYRNCFEISGGSTTRVSVENGLFGNYYNNAKPFDRVKYGVLNILNDPAGVNICYRYGDSYFILKNVRMRTTFTSRDSFANIQNIASCEHYLHVLNEFSNDEFKALLEVALGVVPFLRSSNIKMSEYKEVQYHGPINLYKDIECLVVNPVHRMDAELLENLKKFEEKFDVPYFWMDQYEEYISTQNK